MVKQMDNEQWVPLNRTLDTVKTWIGQKDETLRTRLILNDIKAIARNDVAPVRHGQWIELEDGDCKCSLCGCYHHAWEAHGYYCQHCGARMDKDTKEQDFLVHLPCKVGETVYVEWSDGREYSESVVEKISIDADGQARFLIPSYLHSHSASWRKTSDFGKTIFLTREEAEAAMKEG